MRIIDFRDSFKGFEPKEDILIDSCIILALLNEIDSYYKIIVDLFDNYILETPEILYLYTNFGLVNEITHWADETIRRHVREHKLVLTEEKIAECSNKIKNGTKTLIEKGTVDILDSNKSCILRQIDYAEFFGSMDSATVSIVCSWLRRAGRVYHRAAGQAWRGKHHCGRRGCVSGVQLKPVIACE